MSNLAPPSAGELLAEILVCVDGTPCAGADQSLVEQMITFDAQFHKSPGASLGINCVHVSSTKVCGLLVKSIDAAGTIASWNREHIGTELEIIQPGDFVTKVNDVDGNEVGVKALATALRTASDGRLRLSVWGKRAVAGASAQVKPENEFLALRIQQLEQRSRACTRLEWEQRWLPQLPPRTRTSTTSAASGTCSVCMDEIAMDAQVRGLACGHVFHLQCLAQWFMRDSTFELCCPLCRVSLSEQVDRWISL